MDLLGQFEERISRLENEKSKLSDDNKRLATLVEDLLTTTENLEERISDLENEKRELSNDNNRLEQMMSEMIKGSLDYEYERSNVVIYDIGRKTFEADSYRGKKIAGDKYALEFVQKYIPDYKANDIRTKLLNNDEAILISMACSADAFRLTRKCRANGFTKIRQGLTKPERMISKCVSNKTNQLNSELRSHNVTSDKVYKKRHVHSISQVSKAEPTKPLAEFTPEFNIDYDNVTLDWKVTNMIRKQSTRRKEKPINTENFCTPSNHSQEHLADTSSNAG